MGKSPLLPVSDYPIPKAAKPQPSFVLVLVLLIVIDPTGCWSAIENYCYEIDYEIDYEHNYEHEHDVDPGRIR